MGEPKSCIIFLSKLHGVLKGYQHRFTAKRQWGVYYQCLEANKTYWYILLYTLLFTTIM
jgi:hypothetical protein